MLFWGVLGVRLRGLVCRGVLDVGRSLAGCPFEIGGALWCNAVRKAGLMQGLQFHSCAVRGSGAASCWGNNGNGQVIAFYAMGLCVHGEMMLC